MNPYSIALFTLLSLSCTGDIGSDPFDENGKPSLEGTGYQDSDDDKADGLRGRRGPRTSLDNRSTQVWEVHRKWADRDTEVGMAWRQESGLTWQQKYEAWVDSMERLEDTFLLTTPHGRSFPAPDLECAELAMFLRISFASWYGLPFFMEARSGGKRVFFGHMGIIDSKGKSWRSTPRFRNRFEDFAGAELGTIDDEAWPRDSGLRDRKILGRAEDEQDAFGGAHAGTYFDEIFLNKRVGHFLTYQLGSMGSVNLADSANTFNLKASAFVPGDFLVERFGFSGIGHTVIVKGVRSLDGSVLVDGDLVARREVDVVSGSMPRRQGAWEGPTAARFYFLSEDFGGQPSVSFGAGLKRFRTAVNRGGQWTNIVPTDNEGQWINSNRHRQLVERQETYEQLVPSLAPGERMIALAASIESKRQWLREHPSSCSARSQRELLFKALYQAGREIGVTRQTLDSRHRTLEDYVFAALSYDASKTCCWNSSNQDTYETVMLFNQCLLGEQSGAACDALSEQDQGQCQGPRVFKAYDDNRDGYEQFRRFAEASGRPWASWSADESCPQAAVVSDQIAESDVAGYCEITASCGDC